MKRLIGKSLGNVVFTEQNGNLYGNLTNYGVNASYLISTVDVCGPAKAIILTEPLLQARNSGFL